MNTTYLRLCLACGLLSCWLVSLGGGFVGGGLVHLALIAAVAVVPWKTLRTERHADLRHLADRDEDKTAAGAAKDSSE